VSQQTVSTVERGRFGRLSVDAYCRIADVLDADVQLAPRWRGPKLDRLLDRRHAFLQNRVVEKLIQLGWEVHTEQSFNHFGDRGSVDVLGWRPDLGALLILEIKSEITSLEETLRRIDVKARAYPKAARKERGWVPRMVGVAVVLPDATAHRNLLRRHSALVAASLPARTVAVRRWRPSQRAICVASGFCAIPAEGVLCDGSSRAVASEPLTRGAEGRLEVRIIPARA
jgi:hypothetical protein